MTPEQIEQTVSASTKVSYGASAGIFGMGALSINEIAVVIGMVLGVATFIVNWVYRHKHYKLEKSRVGQNQSSNGR